MRIEIFYLCDNLNRIGDDLELVRSLALEINAGLG